MILAIAPSPAVDVTYVVDELRDDEPARPREVHRVAGGKAINAARAAAALGATVRVLAPLAGRMGDLITDELVGARIGLRRVEGSGPTRMCVSILSRDTGRLTEIYEPAPALAPVWARLRSAIDSELHDLRPRWTLLSGSVPEADDVDAVDGISEAVHGAGSRLAIDTHGSALVRALERAPALVKVNRAEAAAALGRDADAPTLSRLLAERTGGAAVVTDGRAGVGASDAEGDLRLVLPDVDGPFPVGSGDVLLGSLVAGLDAGASLRDALPHAVAAATANALLPGAAVFRPEDVAELLTRVVAG